MDKPIDETTEVEYADEQATDAEMIEMIKKFRRCENRLQAILAEIELMDHPFASQITHALMGETFDWFEQHTPAKKLLDPKTWDVVPQS